MPAGESHDPFPLRTSVYTTRRDVGVFLTQFMDDALRNPEKVAYADFWHGGREYGVDIWATTDATPTLQITIDTRSVALTAREIQARLRGIRLIDVGTGHVALRMDGDSGDMAETLYICLRYVCGIGEGDLLEVNEWWT